jgi:hypothetical protein
MVPFVLRLSNYCFEYGVSLYSQFIVNLISNAGQFVNVEFFQGVHHSPFVGVLDNVHYVFHWAEIMSFV